MRKSLLFCLLSIFALPQQPGQELKPDAPLPVMVFLPGPEPMIEVSDGRGHRIRLRWIDGALDAQGDYQAGAQTLFHLFEEQIRTNLKIPCQASEERPKNCGPWKMSFHDGRVIRGNSCLPQ